MDMQQVAQKQLERATDKMKNIGVKKGKASKTTRRNMWLAKKAANPESYLEAAHAEAEQQMMDAQTHAPLA